VYQKDTGQDSRVLASMSSGVIVTRLGVDWRILVLTHHEISRISRFRDSLIIPDLAPKTSLLTPVASAERSGVGLRACLTASRLPSGQVRVAVG
jgi:hypothetical protein